VRKVMIAHAPRLRTIKSTRLLREDAVYHTPRKCMIAVPTSAPTKDCLLESCDAFQDNVDNTKASIPGLVECSVVGLPEQFIA
jgi:hypothetical protein